MGSLDYRGLLGILRLGTIRFTNCRTIPLHTGPAGRCTRGCCRPRAEYFQESPKKPHIAPPRRLVKRRATVRHITTRCWDYLECVDAGPG